MKASERVGVGIALLLAALGLVNGLQAATDHLGSSDFPPHARFHAALSGVYLVVLSLVAGGMACVDKARSFGRGIPFLLVLISLPSGFLVALAVVPAGSPGGSYLHLAVVGLIMAALAFALSAGSRRR